VIGRTYLARLFGPDFKRLPPEPVVVLARSSFRRGSPRNVLLRREDGTLVVRPFRGLRKP
jgi:hypothetical protein